MPLDANGLGQQQFWESRQGNGLTDWLIGRAREPHPITQLMPSFQQWAKAALGSGMRLANAAHQAAQGEMQIPASTMMDVANILPLTGLFGAGGKLALAANAPKAAPFFSALSKGVEAAPLTQAPSSQWLGTIKNMPGIKQEELDWIGVPEWLQSQKGPVTKQQLSDFIRSNQVDVQEVVKGEPVYKPHVYREGDRFIIRDQEGHVLGNFGDRQAAEARANTLGINYNIIDDGDHWLVEGPNGERWGTLSRNDAPNAEFARRVVREEWLPDMEVTYPGNTKFSQYQLPGGENYRELLLTLPDSGPKKMAEARGKMADALRVKYGDNFADHWTDAEKSEWMATTAPTAFKSGHYDEPNVLAHVRFNDRVDSAGKKTLFIEEIQSDWHQRGRKQGYSGGDRAKREAEIKSKLDALAREYDDMGNRRLNGAPGEQAQAIQRRLDITDEMNALHDERSQLMKEEGVPDAPFKSSWPELSLKRMIKWAVDNGYDSVSWTPGKVQAARYDLSKQIDTIVANKTSDGDFHLRIKPKNSGEEISRRLPEKDLEDTVGKEMADKIRKDATEPFKHTVYSGLDLQVGGEGMKAFYDKMLVNAANKLGKKFGAKVQTTILGSESKDPVTLLRQKLVDLDYDPNTVELGTILADNGGRLPRFITEAEGEMLSNGEHFVETAGRSGVSGTAQEVWSLPITDAMRSKVQTEGFPLFTGGAPMPFSADSLGQQQQLTPEQAKLYMRGRLS